LTISPIPVSKLVVMHGPGWIELDDSLTFISAWYL